MDSAVLLKALEKSTTEQSLRFAYLKKMRTIIALNEGWPNAHAINEIQRYEYEMPILCAANCLQPNGHNDNGWDQGLLFCPSRKSGAAILLCDANDRRQLPTLFAWKAM